MTPPSSRRTTTRSDGVILILASRVDDGARLLAERWCSHGARLLTPEDVASPGWRFEVGSPEQSVTVVGGERLCASEITGVLTRLPAVYEAELRWIEPADRQYVAAEMTVFLIAWLSALPCPVLNRPAPTGLMGPGWRPEQWVQAAASAGLPVVPAVRAVHPITLMDQSPLPSFTIVTVVRKRCFGAEDEEHANLARALARVGGVDLLRVHLMTTEEGPAIAGADYWIDLADPTVTGAVLECFREER